MTSTAANPFLAGDSAVRSLNRARIEALPGVEVDDDVIGQSGFELLSAGALRDLIIEQTGRHDPDPESPELLRQLDGWLDSREQRPLALSIAHRYGRRLGFLLLMLRRGDEANRASRPEWSDAHWTFWREIRQLFVGGGLVAGRIGAPILKAASELLRQYDSAPLAITRSPYPAHLPLLGLARAAPEEAASMLVLDFGQSAVKRGIATYEVGALVRLEFLPAVASVCGDLFAPTLAHEAALRWERMLDIIQDSWEHGRHIEPSLNAVGVALACYLFKGHPSPRDQGCFGSLQQLSGHFESFMEEQVTARMNAAMPMVLMHDGAAAAAAHAGARNAVVLTLGTAIGSGFPPPDEGFRALRLRGDQAPYRPRS